MFLIYSLICYDVSWFYSLTAKGNRAKNLGDSPARFLVMGETYGKKFQI